MEQKIVMFIDTIGFNGGAERQFAGLAVMLVEKGFHVDVLAYYPEKGYKNFIEAGGAKVHILDFGKSRSNKILCAKRVIDNLSPDVVISYKNGPNIIACILKLLGAKWKLIVSDRNTLQGISFPTRIQYLLYRFANSIVPNSISQYNFIAHVFPLLERKTNVITNFTDTDIFHPLTRIDRTDKSRIKKLLVVGRITPQKNVLLFLDAIYKLKRKCPYRFIVEWYGGQKDHAYIDLCKRKLDDLDLSDVFIFKNTTQNMPEIYRSADIFCLPSIYEGFPNVLCEAMASGLPVAASRVCDNPYIVTENIDGVLFDPNDINDIVLKLKWLIEMDCQKLSDIGRKARLTVINKCSRTKFINSYTQLIAKVLN